MATENALVAAHFLRFERKELSFEQALEIVQKDLSQKGVFACEGICITNTIDTPQRCLGCDKVKNTFGDGTLQVCAKCVLPKDIYEKYLVKTPVIVYKGPDPATLSKIEQQMKLLSRK